jgi:hypothetical protein
MPVILEACVSEELYSQDSEATIVDLSSLGVIEIV